ncbi:MAG: hypothetical protein AB7F59_09290 [Bdellovibrionales bacterium]
MTLDQFLGWFLKHNVILIEGLIILILASVSFVLFRSVLRGKEDEESASSLKDIEKTLRQVLESTNAKPSIEVEKAASLIHDSEVPVVPIAAAAPAPTMDPQAAAIAAAQAQDLERLRREMQDKEKTLAELQKSLEEAKKAQSAAPVGAPTVDTKPLEEKIKELQAKLAEYEIIEDDIANLSTYKQENQKLKSELDSLKSKFSSSKAAETGDSSDNVKKFAALVGTAPPPATPTGGPATSKAAEPEVAIPISPPSAAAAAPETPPAAAPAPTPVVVAPTAAPAATVTAAPAAEPTTPPIVVQTGPLPDSPKPVTQVPDKASAESLIGEVDTDKLLAETEKLPDAPPSDPNAPSEDSGAKLISEFENFMKGG